MRSVRSALLVLAAGFLALGLLGRSAIETRADAKPLTVVATTGMIAALLIQKRTAVPSKSQIRLGLKGLKAQG